MKRSGARIWGGLLVAGTVLGGASGCQQPNGQMALPSNPMVGSTRVPAPPTGSVGANGYTPAPYQPATAVGQAAVGLPASDLVAQIGSAATPQFTAATNVPPAGSFATRGTTQTPAQPSTQFPAPPAGAVVPAAFAATGGSAPSPAGLSPAGFPPAGLSPAAALQQASYGDTAHASVASAPAVAPQLRGMQVNDLTPAGQAPHLHFQQPQQAPRTIYPRPITPSPITPSHMTSSHLSTGPTTAGTSTHSTTTGAGQATVPTDNWGAVGSGVAPASSNTVSRPIADNTARTQDQNLPWRAPTRAR
ncbi:hypothetical protein [Roseimaritima sediminicola]|uniref:hypothetical protein n=1 Tax=Roseimaritima sediminicola TaxID=2662066 RepID=UPI0012985781|nr:hypothetical protein [Roseimaritima sediminicola]